MILFPAIDLKDGRCVRLRQGRMEDATVFNDDPAAQARAFADAGCAWLHLVDLDGAFAGHAVNGRAVDSILAAVEVPVQLGGGIRDRAAIDAWLKKGVRRVILGTAALHDPDLVREACRAHPGRIVVAIDSRGGHVAVSGWAEESRISAVELARRFEDSGVAALIHTDIERDGMMQGLDVDGTAALARVLDTPVIASGGLASLDDLRALKAREADGIEGVIAGRALYDGRIDLARALAVLESGAGKGAAC